jgi:hypothetical protein
MAVREGVTCGSCGAQVVLPEPSSGASDSIVAACDVLVLRALELVGKRIVRLERSRYQRMGGRPWHEVHLLWQPDAQAVEQGLAHAWDAVGLVVEEHGCCGVTGPQLRLILDRYVRDLLTTMQGHTATDLRYRLQVYLAKDV